MKRRKINSRGFTLIEIIVAIGLVVLLGGFTIVSLSAIPQAKMRESAQLLKSEFEITREFAKSHGGQSEIEIKKVPEGLEIIRTGENISTENTLLKDRNLALFYTITGSTVEYELGTNDHVSVDNKSLNFTFSQTEGAMIGPDMVDYIIISNGSKNYKFYIKQSTGMIYYDYEIEEEHFDENVVNNNVLVVSIPTFIEKGAFTTTVTLNHTGTSIQPEINYDSRYVKIGGIYRAIDRNTRDGYTITFSLKDPYTTKWSDGSISDKVLTWYIK